METQAVEFAGDMDFSEEWLHHVIALLETAACQIELGKPAAQGTIRRASSLLRRKMNPQASAEFPDGKGRLLAWQARKVCDYIDSHIAGRIQVADLSVLVQRSEAHFGRSFKATFGVSPHAFVVRRRIELATREMLLTHASLNEIALRFGFSDQAHFSRRFRQVTGRTPGAWRRACRTTEWEDVLVDSEGTDVLAA